MDFPLVTIEAKKDNFEELPEILNKLHIDDKWVDDLIESIKKRKNGNAIVDVLREFSDLWGCKKNHENLYRLYCVNRDLIQLDSPLYGNPYEFIDDINKFPVKREKWDINDIIGGYLDLMYMKGLPYDYDRLKPLKKNIEDCLNDLMLNQVIYSFDIGDVYDCPASKDDEADDWFSLGRTVKVIRIL